jgi:hypothetical protein
VSFNRRAFGDLGVPLLKARSSAAVGVEYLRERGWSAKGIREANFRWLNRDEVLARWSTAEAKANGDHERRVKILGAALLPFPNDPHYGVARVFYDGTPLDEDAPKFLTPGGVPAQPYIGEGVSKKPAKPLVLIESPFKAAVAALKGLGGIGINGCTGCHVKNARLSSKPSEAEARAWFRPELRPYLQPGRKVLFVTDADCETNPQVGAAQLDFLDAAMALGCEPLFRPLPAGGIDDYLVNHRVTDFHRLKTYDYNSRRVADLRESVGSG